VSNHRAQIVAADYRLSTVNCVYQANHIANKLIRHSWQEVFRGTRA
jgi:hypothetical protein